MMNPMQSQMGGMGQPELSEEELKKLALLLQQMPADEGLATINQDEAQLLKDSGGSGRPLAGTQGLGPAGGQVKSYAKKEDGRIDEDHRIAILTDAEVEALNYLKHQDKDQGYPTGNGPLIQALSSMNTHDLDYHTVKGMEIPSLNDFGSEENEDGNISAEFGGVSNDYSPGPQGSSTGTQPKKEEKTWSLNPLDWEGFGGDLKADWGGYFASLPQAERPYDIRFETDPAKIQAYYRANPGEINSSGPSGGSGTQPPPKYYDKNGKEHGSQAEADAANAAIDAAMSGIEGSSLTSDSTFQRWHAKNKDDSAYAGLTEAQMEQAYNIALTKSMEAAGSQLPAAVENMNNYLKTAGAGSTYETWLATIPEADRPKNISDATLRQMYAKATQKAERNEAFTLTPEEVAEFSRDAIVTDEVSNAVRQEIGNIDAAAETTVGEVADVTPTELKAIQEVTDADMDVVFAGGIDKAEEMLLKRYTGEAVSPAEQQLKRSTEANLRMMLGATAGGDADPAKVRQLKNIWVDQQQWATGEAADLRSQESLAAEKQLVELYKGKSTAKLNQKLANMEMRKQEAFKQGDLTLAGKLANQQSTLTRVITQANIEKDTKLANLEAMKEKAIAQGKMDLATSLANLQKNVSLATVNAELASRGRAQDDALAMAAYQGQQALQGLEVDVDTTKMQNELTEMGFDLQRDLAELDSATQIKVAELTAQWRRAQGDDQKQAAIIGAIATLIIGFATTSDIRAKENISSADDEVESFLDALNAYQYEYSDPASEDEAGMFAGVMAQDLEKSPMGASFVKDTPKGKMVDYGHGLAAILASQANLHERLKSIEEGGI